MTPQILKTICVWFFLYTMQSTIALSQSTLKLDSIRKTARRDAKEFRLDDTVWRRYKRKLPLSSDYFKPGKTNDNNRALVNDSTYVQTYRKAAFKRNKRRRTPWHYALVGGGIAASIVVITIGTIIIVAGPTMN